MRKFDEKVTFRLQQLIKQGEHLLTTKRPGYLGTLDNRLLSQ